MAYNRKTRRELLGRIARLEAAACQKCCAHEWSPIPDPGGYIGDECHLCGINRTVFEQQQQPKHAARPPHENTMAGRK